jgi:hypothetical protein
MKINEKTIDPWISHDMINILVRSTELSMTKDMFWKQFSMLLVYLNEKTPASFSTFPNALKERYTTPNKDLCVSVNGKGVHQLGTVGYISAALMQHNVTSCDRVAVQLLFVSLLLSYRLLLPSMVGRIYARNNRMRKSSRKKSGNSSSKGQLSLDQFITPKPNIVPSKTATTYNTKLQAFALDGDDKLITWADMASSAVIGKDVHDKGTSSKVTRKRHASSQEIEEHDDDNVEVDDGSSSKGKKRHRSTNTK